MGPVELGFTSTYSCVDVFKMFNCWLAIEITPLISLIEESSNIASDAKLTLEHIVIQMLRTFLVAPGVRYGDQNTRWYHVLSSST